MNDLQTLYNRLLEAWNRQDAAGFAGLFTEDTDAIGFDGTQMNGSSEIELSLREIFADHATSRYVASVRETRLLSPTVGLLQALTGLVPAGDEDIAPALNAIQTVVAVREDGGWRIELFQNTPAAFHGRPHLVDEMTEELRRLL